MDFCPTFMSHFYFMILTGPHFMLGAAKNIKCRFDVIFAYWVRLSVYMEVKMILRKQK